MKFKLIAGALALSVVGALAYFLLSNRHDSASDVDQKGELNPSEQGVRTNAHDEVNAAAIRKPANKIKGKGFQPAAERVERTASTESPNREAMEENEREREELQWMRNEIAELEAEIREGHLDTQRTRPRRAVKKRVARTRQVGPGVSDRQVRMPGGTNGVPTDLVDGKDIQQTPSPSTGKGGFLEQPAVADPVNPKPGMIFKGYNIGRSNNMFELASQLEKCPAVKTTVVTDGKFSPESFKDVSIHQGVWEGFLKCNRTANCTILVKQDGNRHIAHGYAIIINGKKFMTGTGQGVNTVTLKAGFNHVKILVENLPVSISLKATDSTREPKPLTPKDMWYDEKPDEVDVF